MILIEVSISGMERNMRDNVSLTNCRYGSKLQNPLRGATRIYH